MRILHTADWHIGAKTDDLDRFNEQKEALKKALEENKSDEILNIFHPEVGNE